ncbi:MAG: YajQ family cyclic di-GMP-binding protein [Coriobacteriales bacterium]|nr:YajQ family cyclic di-GMP-binding protein [Coriobacteriales bacterium]
MAKDNSFDIVCQANLNEVENAYNQALKALKQRYDLKDSGSKIDYDKANALLTVTAPSEFVCGQVIDVLTSALTKRKVDLKSVSWSNFIDAAGGNVKKTGTIIQGIDQEIARKINKDIKAEKFKVKVTIEGDKLRVSGPKRDDLQEVIAFVKEKDYGLPLQFTNYR